MIDGPILEAAHILVREYLRLGIARHAQGGADDAQVEQRLKGAQRIAVKFALIIDAAHARALDKVVRQDFIPQIDDLFRL